MKIAIRMDDITADMNWKNFLALKEAVRQARYLPSDRRGAG